MQREPFRVLTLSGPSLLGGSRWDRWLVWFPLVGWTIGLLMQLRRVGKAIRIIRTQLAERDRFPSVAWVLAGANPAVAERVARVIADAFVWPNYYYLPDDPCALLLVDGEGMGPFDASYALSKALGVRIWPRDIPIGGSFEQLVVTVTRSPAAA